MNAHLMFGTGQEETRDERAAEISIRCGRDRALQVPRKGLRVSKGLLL